MRHEPEIVASARTPDGVAFELRKDPRGVLRVPGLASVLIAVHVGPPARIACRRDGRQFLGTAVHGDIDIIPGQTPANWEMLDQNDTALLVSLPQKLIHLATTAFNLPANRVEIRNRFQIRDPELESLSWAMKREMEFDYPSGRLYLDGLALAMASRLVAQHSSAMPARQRIDGLSGRRLKKVLSYIEDHLADDLPLEEIARAAELSPSYLKAQFRKSLGVPVHQYVIHRRVERARALLEQGNLSMADVAHAAGFSHQSHMARHMRRILGGSPLAIQRAMTGNSGPL